MIRKTGQFGDFLSCSNYPECTHTQPIELDEETKQVQENEIKALQKQFKDNTCSKCGHLMNVKKGKFGFFLGCTNYPLCKNIQGIKISSGIKCPKCKNSDLIEKQTQKTNKHFWGCDNYPKCNFATWNKPIFINKETGDLMVESKNGDIIKYKKPKQIKP